MAKKKTTAKESLASELRSAIQDSHISANELAKKTGIPQPTISRFLNGQDMGIERASVIARHLGLKLVRMLQLTPRKTPEGLQTSSTKSVTVEIVHGDIYPRKDIPAVSKSKRSRKN